MSPNKMSRNIRTFVQSFIWRMNIITGILFTRFSRLSQNSQRMNIFYINQASLEPIIDFAARARRHNWDMRCYFIKSASLDFFSSIMMMFGSLRRKLGGEHWAGVTGCPHFSTTLSGCLLFLSFGTTLYTNPVGIYRWKAKTIILRTTFINETL